jgi:ribosome maturation factor RimP
LQAPKRIRQTLNKRMVAVSNVDAQVETLRQRLAPAVAALDLELYDVELAGAGKQRTLRVTVNGIDLDAITAVTQAVSPILDDAPELTGSFLLEVSSPGVERTLRTPAHYAGAVGETISVKVRTDTGTRRLQGKLVASDDTTCTVEVEGEREQLAYADITQARTVFEWGPQPRPGQAKKSKRPAASKARAGASKGVTA